MPRPGRLSHSILYVGVLVLLLLKFTEGLQSPVVGEVYSNAEMSGLLVQPTASGTGALSIQSATAATSGPTCNGDVECQALCPVTDFTQAQPALPAAAVQQQVGAAIQSASRSATDTYNLEVTIVCTTISTSILESEHCARTFDVFQATSSIPKPTHKTNSFVWSFTSNGNFLSNTILTQVSHIFAVFLCLQLAQCANAMRTSPGSFAGIINGVCNFADFQTDVTKPPRPPWVVDLVLKRVSSTDTSPAA